MEKLAKKLLEEAIENDAHDLYILPHESLYQLYFRTDNGRILAAELEVGSALALISHFKFVAGMNVGEKRRSQLGACFYSLSAGGRRLRLSSVGDFEGRESLVIRLLHDGKENLRFWFEEDLEQALELVRQRGLYLFSGPVGSGKTSLMYHLAKTGFQDRQVITIEDPVELVDPDFLQLQLNDMIGSSYDELIKLSLRHMPDLVIVGEIRDERTARAVIRASLTGYTVFSTVHAKSIAGVYGRLLELGISRGELTNALCGTVYSRLIMGRGVLDIAKSNYESHDTGIWNAKLEALAEAGLIKSTEFEAEKVTAG